MNFPGGASFIPRPSLRAAMVLWVGVDDTDSLRGMCTTFLATEIIKDLAQDHDLIGYPRLVRLNPSIPWKTRGNGAVCLRVGRGRGRPFPVGEIGGVALRAFPSGTSTDDIGLVLRRIVALLERWAELSDPTTNPGVVVLDRRPPPSLYWRAVRDVVPLEAVQELLRGRGQWRGFKNQRGLIGACAATAWRPRDRTYELLAYRARAAWGRVRELDPGSVLEMDRRFPTTFNNIDPATRHVALAPHSPCPVLFGIRGDDPGTLPTARRVLKGEEPDCWVIVETNQGTDDHITNDEWRFRPCLSTRLDVTVAEPPRTIPGGHVLVPARGRRSLELAFYEPSKEFRGVGRALHPGDRLRVYGSLRDDLRSLNVEKVWVRDLAPWVQRSGNPKCPVCGKSMKSIGRDKGFRCIRGHGRARPGSAPMDELPRALRPGWYEPPVYARRHLTKPAKRLGVPSRPAPRPSSADGP